MLVLNRLTVAAMVNHSSCAPSCFASNEAEAVRTHSVTDSPVAYTYSVSRLQCIHMTTDDDPV